MTRPPRSCITHLSGNARRVSQTRTDVFMNARCELKVYPNVAKNRSSAFALASLGLSKPLNAGCCPVCQRLTLFLWHLFMLDDNQIATIMPLPRLRYLDVLRGGVTRRIQRTTKPNEVLLAEDLLWMLHMSHQVVSVYLVIL